MNSAFISSVLLLNIASVFAYNRSILYRSGKFNKEYPGAVGHGVELIYGFDLPDDFDPLVKCSTKSINFEQSNQILAFLVIYNISVPRYE